MKLLPILFVVCLLLSCSGEDATAPHTSVTTKVFAIDVNDHYPCSEATAQQLCISLGYDDCIHYRCKNPDNSGVYIYEVTCVR